MNRVAMHVFVGAFTVIVGSACSPAPETTAARLAEYPDIASIRASLDAGELSVHQVVEQLAERADQRASLNAYITLATAAALTRADQLDSQDGTKGRLHGIPLIVKDNIHVAGLPNTAGTPGLRDFVPVENNAVVERLLAAGAVIMGKANLHELAFGITSDNSAFGAVGNPFNPALFAGGSSGGTAAAISAGLVPAGLGTDTGGSARIPAALTGIVGFRPSSGRYPSAGVTPISHTRDTVGLLGRTVADVRLLDEVVSGGDGAEPVSLARIRLGVPRAYFYAGLDSQTEAVIEEALGRLRSSGVTLVETEVPGVGELIAASAFPIALYEVASDLPAYLETHSTGLTLDQLAAAAASPDVKGIFAAVQAGSGGVDAQAYAAALQAREQLRAIYREVFVAHDLDGLVFPTTLLPARLISGSLENVTLNGESVPTFPTYIRNTDPASIAALPGISLPAGLTADGLPVGLEIDGPEGSDAHLLAIAAAIEAVLEFSARPPQG